MKEDLIIGCDLKKPRRLLPFLFIVARLDSPDIGAARQAGAELKAARLSAIFAPGRGGRRILVIADAPVQLAIRQGLILILAIGPIQLNSYYSYAGSKRGCPKCYGTAFRDSVQPSPVTAHVVAESRNAFTRFEHTRLK